jgi:hypothetical protein
MKSIKEYKETGDYKGFQYSAMFDKRAKIFRGVVFTPYMVTFETPNFDGIMEMIDKTVELELFIRANNSRLKNGSVASVAGDL